MGMNVSELIKQSRIMREMARVRCLEMYAEGKSYATVAKLASIDVNVVRTWVKAAGIARSQKEAQRAFIKEYNARRQRK